MANLSGTSLDDTLSGGLHRDDFITASPGSDLLNAGQPWLPNTWKLPGFDDHDTVSYAAVWRAYGLGDAAALSIVADLALGTVQKLAGSTLLGTDTLVGADALQGGAGNDRLLGRSGWAYESFRGGAGDDFIDGRGGIDGADYANAGAGIRVSLAAGIVTGPAATVGTDTLRGIERVDGSNFADFFDATGYGGTLSSFSTVGPGTGPNLNRNAYAENWNLFAPLGGNDTVVGNGETILDYASAGGALHLSLAALTSLYARADILVSYSDDPASSAGTAPGLSPLVSGVNGLRGGAYDDTLIGGGFVNNGGGNALSGDVGYERFRGNGGNDFIDGGKGLDRAEYNGAEPMSRGITVLLAQGTVTGDALAVGTDTLRGIEVVVGTTLDDVYDATGFTLSNAASPSPNSGDVRPGVPPTETALLALAFNEFRPVGGHDLVTGNGATRVSFANMDFEREDGSQPPVVFTFTGADAGTATIGPPGSDLGELRFTGVFAAQGGAGNDSLTGAEGFQQLRGYWGNDTLLGGDGNDLLQGHGSPGSNINNGSVYSDDDSLDGGAGNDTLYGDFGSDTLLGGADNDLLWGGSGNDRLDGGSGDDSLDGGYGDDVLVGGAGNDTLNGGVPLYDPLGLFGSEGDTASYATAPAAVSVDLGLGGPQDTGGAGSDMLSNIPNLIGSAFNDHLVGNYAANVLEGGAGNDTLDGGGDGLDDTASYAGAVAAVSVNLTVAGAQDTRGAGIDTLLRIENLIGSRFNDRLGGDGGDNVIEGGDGNDVVDGGLGLDTASYAHAASAVTVTLALAAGAAQDTRGAGTDRLSGIEHLRGSAFGDVLTGNAGENWIDGAAGADTLAGGAGDDDYSVDSSDDVVTETAAGGLHDAVHSTASWTMSANVEFLYLEDTGLTGTGNAADNFIGGYYGPYDYYGDHQGVVLYGRGGNDTLQGGTGDDWFQGGSGNDSIVGGYESTFPGQSGVGDTVSYEDATAAVKVSLLAGSASGGAGNDTLSEIEDVVGSRFADLLIGDQAANRLDGGAGKDSLAGGDGNDVYVVDAAGDVVAELPGGGWDLVESRISYSLVDTDGAGRPNGGQVEALRLVGSGAINGTGNALDNTLYAGAGDNRLDGGAGTDLVSYADAGAGVGVSLALTTAQATGGSGSDRLLNVENLAGSRYDDRLAGNQGPNLLLGDAGYDLLEGAAGADTLQGGAGADTLDGGDGDDLLTGGTGPDQLSGGSGADVFRFETATDLGTTSVNCDVVTDFQPGTDRIDLRGVDADTGSFGGTDAFTQILGAGQAFSAPGQLRLDGELLWLNTDTDATPEYAIRLAGVTALTLADFTL